MEEIKFTKIIDYTALYEAINIRTSLHDILKKIDYSFTNGFSEGETLTDNLVFHFSEALSSDQKDELADIVNSVDSSYDLVIRNNIKNTRVKDKLAFGKEFIAIVSANNEFLEKDASKVGALLETYPSLIMCCLTGAIDLLYGLMMTMQPDDNISIEELTEYRKRIELFLRFNNADNL